MSDVVLLDGQFLNSKEARVHVYDGGFLHGAGLFETMWARNRRVFRLQTHLDRLRHSASEILVPIDPTILPNSNDLAELLERNNRSVGRLRLTVTVGAMRTEHKDPEVPTPTVCATVGEAGVYGPEFYERGVKVAISRFKTSPSDPTAGHKTTGYLPRLLALREAQKVQCLEALWFTTDHSLAEGSITNVFVVSDGILKTPPLDTPVLPGIARGIALELATELGIETAQSKLTINDLLDADEVILTNAIMQIMPVVAVENSTIAEGRVGPLARKLLAGYRRLVQKECDAL